jgi:replicative DNA helicase
MTDVELQQPPASREAEESLLGCLMLNARAASRVADILTPEDFYWSANGHLFREICAAVSEIPADDQTTVDWVMLAERLAGTPVAEVWPPESLIDLASSTPSAANAPAYAHMIRETSLKRQLLGTYMGAVNSLYADRSRSAAEIAAKIQSATMHITARAEKGQGLRPVKEYARRMFQDLQQRWESGNAMTGLETPWGPINDVTHGLQPAHLIIAAGRPGMGKSIYGYAIAEHAAKLGHRAAIFSLEMGGDELVQRSVSSRGRVPWEWLRSPRAWKGGDDDDFWARTSAVVAEIIGENLLIDETPRLSIGQLVARAERAHMDAPLSLAVVDHLHIMDPEQRPSQNLADALAGVSGGLKGLAKRLKIPVLALAQLNRANTQRIEKRPTMADLRSSGAIEQDADIVKLLHREDYYKQPHEPKSHRLEVIWGKGRSLPTGEPTVLHERYDEMRIDVWEDGPPPPTEALPPPPKRTGGWGSRPKQHEYTRGE